MSRSVNRFLIDWLLLGKGSRKCFSSHNLFLSFNQIQRKQNNIENILQEDVIFMKNQLRVFIIIFMKNMPPVVIVAIIVAVVVLLIQYFFNF